MKNYILNYAQNNIICYYSNLYWSKLYIITAIFSFLLFLQNFFNKFGFLLLLAYVLFSSLSLDNKLKIKFLLSYSISIIFSFEDILFISKLSSIIEVLMLTQFNYST